MTTPERHPHAFMPGVKYAAEGYPEPMEVLEVLEVLEVRRRRRGGSALVRFHGEESWEQIYLGPHAEMLSIGGESGAYVFTALRRARRC